MYHIDNNQFKFNIMLVKLNLIFIMLYILMHVFGDIIKLELKRQTIVTPPKKYPLPH